MHFLFTVAQNFLRQGSIDVSSTRLTISVPRPMCSTKKADSGPVESDTVEVTGIPSGIPGDYLRMYFESENRCGKIVDMNFEKESGTAIITFKSSSG